MSDELEAMAKGGGVVAGLTLMVGTMWRAFTRRADKNEDKVEADKEARIHHLELAKESHRQQLEELKRSVVELDTRLKFREGAYGTEPLTSPGTRPSPLVEALRRRSNDGE